LILVPTKYRRNGLQWLGKKKIGKVMANLRVCVRSSKDVLCDVVQVGGNAQELTEVELSDNIQLIWKAKMSKIEQLRVKASSSSLNSVMLTFGKSVTIKEPTIAFTEVLVLSLENASGGRTENSTRQGYLTDHTNVSFHVLGMAI
jgi:hypothetical protein